MTYETFDLGNGLTCKTLPKENEHGTFYNSYQVLNSATCMVVHNIEFQDGPPPQVGINGVSIEALLQICKHRLEAFQATKFSCDFNANAIEGIDSALESLNARTAERQSRGVEGTYKE